MKKLSLFIAALAASTAMPALAATTLTGSTVTATLLYPDQATIYSGPATAIVGSGVEFGPGTFAPAIGTFDIGANTISFFSNQSGSYGTAGFNGYRLDFAGRTITSLTLAAGSTFTPLNYTFNGSSVFLNVSGQDPQGGNALFDVGVAAVPEPATWAMMLMGFGMIGFGLRNRQKPTVRVTYA